MIDISSLVDYARECLKNVPSSTKRLESFKFRDRFTHTLRVMYWCDRLLERVPAQRNIVLAAAALHDIGYLIASQGHAEHSAQMAKAFLLQQESIEESILLNICDLIAHHSDKQLLATQMSNELIVLQDADCLDEIGALSVLWDAMAEGAQELQSYNKVYLRILVTYNNLTSRNRVLKSEYGRELYQNRLGFLREFVEQLRFELFIKEEKE